MFLDSGILHIREPAEIQGIFFFQDFWKVWACGWVSSAPENYDSFVLACLLGNTLDQPWAVTSKIVQGCLGFRVKVNPMVDCRQ